MVNELGIAEEFEDVVELGHRISNGLFVNQLGEVRDERDIVFDACVLLEEISQFSVFSATFDFSSCHHTQRRVLGP